MFQRGIKAWALLLLPNLRLKSDGELKRALNIQSIMTIIEEPEGSENQATCSALCSSISTEGLNTIPSNIREMLKHERCYTTIAARKLLVPLSDLSQAYVASLLSISKNYAGCFCFSKPKLISCISHKGCLFRSMARPNRMCQGILSPWL